MTTIKLKDRIESYMEASNNKLLARLPVVIVVNGRSFNKATSFLDKPFSKEFADNMLSATVKLCMEVEGSLFAYQYNDTIVIISRNDQNKETLPWYDNRIQKISSIASSLATQQFHEHMNSSDLNMMGDVLFTAQTFAVPNISEAINTIIYYQQKNFHISIQFACIYELLKSYDKSTIKEMLADLGTDEKIDLLQQECDIDFNAYPQSFRRGIACYKIPKVIDGTVKNKWTVNDALPIFIKDQSFLSNIFRTGVDIFRNEWLKN